jgi:methylated-DNA-protein-cysteine methyltransferase-like protein
VDAGVSKDDRLFDRIYALVRQVPRGRVVSYGQVAQMVGACTPRQVGYAMAAVTAESDVPWQRVINSQGRISERAGGGECVAQRQLLEQEGVRFSAAGRVDFARFGWLEAGGVEAKRRRPSRSRRAP